MEADSYVARPMRTARWSLVRAGEAVAVADGVCRPDGRWYVSIDTWDDSADATLLPAVADDLRHDLYTNIDAADDAALTRWQRLGFVIDRREVEFMIPTDPWLTGLADVAVPAGIVLLPADAVDEHRLRELDDTLRADVPGSEGWRNDPDEFHDYTFDERHFDAQAYLVAVDDRFHRFAGLARVWAARSHQRLGLVRVTRCYRRRGLARAMLAGVLGTMHERGVRDVAAEADATDTASLRLFEQLGAREVGASLVLRRRV